MDLLCTLCTFPTAQPSRRTSCLANGSLIPPSFGTTHLATGARGSALTAIVAEAVSLAEFGSLSGELTATVTLFA